jgi:hypothetical protein
MCTPELVAQHARRMELAGRARTQAKHDAEAAVAAEAAAVEALQQELEAVRLRLAHAT